MLDQYQLNQLIADCKPTPEPNIYRRGVEHLESLRENGPSKLLCVRIDLGIRTEYQPSVHIFQIIDAFKRLKRNRINKPNLFHHNIDLTWCLEWQPDKSYHYHCLFIFDGHKVQNGEYYAHEIGCYWRDVIAKGMGTFWNCNADEDKYPESGIGMIEYRDSLAWHFLLTRVLAYMTKPDPLIRQAIQADAIALGQSVSHIRTFGTGLDRQLGSSNVGRPRLYAVS